MADSSSQAALKLSTSSENASALNAIKHGTRRRASVPRLVSHDVSLLPVDLKKRRTLIVQNKLPFICTKNGNHGWKVEPDFSNLLVSIFYSLREHHGITFAWVGWVGMDVPVDEQEALAAALLEHSAYAIFLPAKVAELHYTGFCKNVLWPLLHYMQVRKFPEDAWEEYKAVNIKFADIIEDIGSSKDLIWIHDYHLLLLPLLIKERMDHREIGFFLHSPFVTSELFRTLPVRDMLIEHVLGADLIGFQSYNDSRHFLSACSKILGLDSSPRGVESADGHFVRIETFPVGIMPEPYIKALDSPSFADVVNQYKKNFEGKQVIIARSRVDPVNGIIYKFAAYTEFFNKYPDWKGKVVLMQIDDPHPEEGETQEIKKLIKKTHEHVGRINGDLGTVSWIPIQYSLKKLSFEESCALYYLADVAVITPLRDGMNLACSEYIVCQRDRYGPLLLSEFTGASSCLAGSRLVNPWNKIDFADALNEALTMSPHERKIKHQHNYRYVTAETGEFWAKSFIEEVIKMGKSGSRQTMKLKPEDVLTGYNNSKRRMIFLDYDGTLSPIAKLPSMAAPTPDLIETLKALPQDPKNFVCVISGRDKPSLEGWLGHIPIGLACEHGWFFRAPGESEWQNAMPEFDSSWKEVVVPILENYTDRTPGSFVEHKTMNVAWHYRNADPDYADWQAKDLCSHLDESKLPIDILRGKKTIEIRPRGINKGTIVKTIMSNFGVGADFVLCIGDDKTDEDMFAPLTEVPNAFTVMVAKKPTTAKYYVQEQADVVRLLRLMTKLPVKREVHRTQSNESLLTM